jgi:hypothetical protein
MSQHDGNIANQGFPAFRSDLNDAIAAIFSWHAGTSRPAGAVSGMVWWDTDTPSASVRTMFLYDGTDDIGLMTVDTTNNYVAKFGVGIQPSAMGSGTVFHAKNGASGGTISGSADDFVFEASASGGATISVPDASNGNLFFAHASSNLVAFLQSDYTNNVFRIATERASAAITIEPDTSTEAARFVALKMLMGDTADANVTQGLCINQGASDDYILTMKSSDVAHGMTGPEGSETDTFGALSKRSSTTGGVFLRGYGEDTLGVALTGYVTNGDSAHTTSANAAVMAYAGKKSGTSPEGAFAANENLFAVSRWSGGVAFIVDAEGDTFQDGTAGTAYDEYDDTSLVRDHNALALSKSGSLTEPVRAAMWRLHRANLMGYVGPREWAKGIRPHINMSATVRLLRGEAVQRAEREAIYVQVQEEMMPGFMARCNELAAGRNVGRLPSPIHVN